MRRWWQASAPARLSHVYDAHQQSVPRLPVPSLDSSVARYLRAARPLQTDAEHAATAAAAAAFLRGEGPSLHRELLAADAALPTASSYLESLWYRAAYLGPRDPVCIHSNPAVLLRSPSDPAAREPLWRAASLLSAIARWVADLRAGTLPPHRTPTGTTLCMSMVPTLLGSARLPEPSCDRIRYAAGDARHVAVLWRGAYHELAVADASGAPLSPHALHASLRALCATTPRPDARMLGALTAGNRDEWARARKSLAEHSATNSASLARIDTALLVLVLDDGPAHSPAGSAEKSAEIHPELARAALCGPAGGRWYDKFQLLVTRGGEAGINFEHSPIDGAQLGYFLGTVVPAAEACAPPAASANSSADGEPPRELTWEIPPAVAAAAAAAADAYTALDDSLECVPLTLRRGLAWAKRAKIGLDAVLQMTFQLAYARAAAHADPRAGGTGSRAGPSSEGPLLPSVYEAAATNTFRHGRTEVIRSVTEASVALVRQMLGQDGGGGGGPGRGGGGATGARLLREAAAAHRDSVRYATSAHGHERHLLALKVLAASAEKSPTPRLFADGGWPRVTSSVISTSGLRSDAIAWFGFGPVLSHGVGIGYLVSAEKVTVNVTSWRGASHVDGRALAGAIPRAFDDLAALAERPQSKL